jgi:hypothetical protein
VKEMEYEVCFVMHTDKIDRNVYNVYMMQ